MEKKVEKSEKQVKIVKTVEIGKKIERKAKHVKKKLKNEEK